MRRKEGFIDVDKMLHDIGVDTTNFDEIIDEELITVIKNDRLANRRFVFSFEYDGEKYFYKYNWIGIPYNELVAEELLKDFGISCVSYDLAVCSGKKGNISKTFKKEKAIYIDGEEILSNFWSNDKYIETHNNLEDIWDALEYRYDNYPNKRKIIEKLMKKIVNIFVFDIISCQYDRHSVNWQIMESDDEIDIAPLYDNEGILTTSGKTPFISLTITDQERGILWPEINEFQAVSSEDYINLIKDKIWIISDENLESVFKKIEDKTGYPMPKHIKEYYLKGYQGHRKRLEKIIVPEDITNKQMR